MNNKLLYRSVEIKKTVINPSNIYIEISGRCNAKCPYCARYRFPNRYSGENMTPDLFEKIINHLLSAGLINNKNSSNIYLYNWGEPFLNPNLNSILSILKNKNLKAGLSSNFIVRPDIEKNNYSVINDVVFSLSGFSQDTYDRIHGNSLRRVLKNFEDFYSKIRTYSPKTKINIAWHRYRFNEYELWNAYNYFDRPGIYFRPTVAYLNDICEMMNYVENKIPKNRLNKAKKDLFLDHISKIIRYYREKVKFFECFMWDFIVIDEYGQLLLCCGMTNKDTEHILGNIIEMSPQNIFSKKQKAPVCKKCISLGIPVSLGPIGNKPLPIGGGLKFYKLWFQLNSNNLYSVIIQRIKHFSMGQIAIDIIKKIFG